MLIIETEKMETGGTPVLRYSFVPVFIRPLFPPFVGFVITRVSNDEKSSKFQRDFKH